jgi:hypothetical protein
MKTYYSADLETQNWSLYKEENAVGAPFRVVVSGVSDSLITKREDETFYGLETPNDGTDGPYEFFVYVSADGTAEVSS